MEKIAKMNAKSYFYTMLFALPALSLGNVISRSDEFIAGFGLISSFILLIFVLIWTIRRLRNAGKSAWWSFTLIPPMTIFLLGYCLFAPSSKAHQNEDLHMYGIRTKGFWPILFVVMISLFLAYLSALYITFLTDGL